MCTLPGRPSQQGSDVATRTGRDSATAGRPVPTFFRDLLVESSRSSAIIRRRLAVDGFGCRRGSVAVADGSTGLGQDSGRGSTARPRSWASLLGHRRRGPGARRGAGRRAATGSRTLQTAVRRQPGPEGGAGLSLRLAGAGRRLLEPRQPLQPPGPGLRLRPEGRPRGGHGREQPLPRPREDQGDLRLPAREHGQSRRRVRRPERPLPGAEGGRRAGGQAPVHRLVRRPRLADHPGRGDRQDGQGLHRGEGLGPDLPGLRRPAARRSSASSSPARRTTRTRPTSTPRRSSSRRTASAAATTPRSPARTPGRSARSARRPPATSRASRPTRPTRAGVQGRRPGPPRLHRLVARAPPRSISGVKAYNNGVNVTDDGRFVPTLFHQLQEQGWKVGTVTSVPFDHVSPAAMYAHNVDRDDYQDLARDMLGLPGIVQEARQGAATPGPRRRHGHGLRDHEPGRGRWRPRARTGCRGTSTSPTPTWRRSTSKNGGKYVVVQTEPGVDGGQALQQAADDGGRAIRAPLRLLRPSGARPPPLPHRRRPVRPRAQHRPRRQAARPRSTPRPTGSRSRPWPT